MNQNVDRLHSKDSGLRTILLGVAVDVDFSSMLSY